MSAPVVLWLRQDLRLADQPALRAAAAAGPVVPLYVLDDGDAADGGPGEWRMGGAQRWWLHHSLTALDADLRALGSRLVLRRGAAAEVVAQVAREAGAGQVHAIRHYEPWWRAAEAALAARVDLRLHDGNHLAPPDRVRSGQGTPFRIYSAFWRGLSALMPPEQPVAAPSELRAPSRWPASDRLADWRLLPTKPDWAGGFSGWTPGEAGAAAALAAFDDVAGYDRRRNLPSEEGSSRLSPHLHFGEISPGQVWRATSRAGAETFQKELAWRDFTTATILARPDYGTANGRAAFDRLAWRDAPDDFAAWTRGRTGYPIVDAGMRQLWTTGWMHNRVRMITASFLVKHLLIDWRQGERWFWDTLVDADYGNNSVNWQWVAGTGVDANMFGRIMAPLVQSRKFDAAGYVRRWVPELAGLSDDTIHDPEEAGCRPDSYPAQLIGHREGRERALAAGRAVRAA